MLMQRSGVWRMMMGRGILNEIHYQNEKLSELYDQYFHFLMKWCYRYVAYHPQYLSRLEDWVQDAFLAALKRPAVLRRHPNVAGWLVLACRHRIDNDLYRDRTRARNTAFSLDQAGVSPPQWDDALERWYAGEDAKASLNAVLSLLSADEQNIYLEYFEGEKTSRQIAEERGKSEPSVKAAIRRIRKKAHSTRPRAWLPLLVGAWCLLRSWLET